MRTSQRTLFRNAGLALVLLLFCPGQSCPDQRITDKPTSTLKDNTVSERQDTNTQGSPIVANVYFPIGAEGSYRPGAAPLEQAIGGGVDGDQLAQFGNTITRTLPDGSVVESLKSPGQQYVVHGNTYNVNITSGGTTPSVSGGGATGTGNASASSAIDASQTSEASPTLTLPINFAVGAAPTVQGGPTATANNAGTTGGQSGDNDAETRLNRVEAKQDQLLDALGKVLPMGNMTPIPKEPTTQPAGDGESDDEPGDGADNPDEQ